MGAEIANENFQVTITAQGGWTPGVPTYTLILAAKASLGNKKILLDKIEWQMSGCVFGSNTYNQDGKNSLAIISDAQKTKCDGKTVIRKGNNGICMGSFTPPSGSAFPCTCMFEITNSGQAKVKAE